MFRKKNSDIFQNDSELATGNVYPNPFQKWDTVPILNNGSEKMMAFEVIDLLGKSVYSAKREVPNGLYTITLDLVETALVKGTYMLVITSESGMKQQLTITKE